jgi:hypothetical protein
MRHTIKKKAHLVNQILKNLERKSQYNGRRWKLKKGETWWNKACVAFSCLAGSPKKSFFDLENPKQGKI